LDQYQPERNKTNRPVTQNLNIAPTKQQTKIKKLKNKRGKMKIK